MAVKVSPKIAVYTCITGNYDVLEKLMAIDDRIDYFCFTEQNYQLDPWVIKPVSNYKLNNKNINRYIKMHPHEVLPEYDITLYIDGNINIVGDLYVLIMECYHAKADIFLYNHFLRECVYEEAKSCIYNSLDWVWSISAQMKRFSKEGYPLNNGLFEANIIIRKNNNIIKSLMNDWWYEYYTGAKRDQLSLSVVAWRKGLNIASLGDSDARKINKYFKYTSRVAQFNFIVTIRKYINRFAVFLLSHDKLFDINADLPDSFDCENKQNNHDRISLEYVGKNQTLAIAIPTYNRAEMLKNNLLSIIDEVRDFSIPLYVSDNSPNEDTEKVVNELQDLYEYIFYFKKEPDFGHDRNILFTLQLPETEYVWLLGDSFSIGNGAIKEVLDAIETERPGVIAVNAENRNLNINSGLYVNHNTVLNEFAWHLTLTGATIYSRDVLSDINKLDSNNYTNFPQIALIFYYLAKKKSFYWINNKWAKSSLNKKGYWASKMFNVFIDDWSNVVRNLPANYNDVIKEKVIIEHSLKSNIFGFKALLNARCLEAYSLNTYKKYEKELLKHSKLSSTTLLMIAFFPKSILRLYLFLKTNKQKV